MMVAAIGGAAWYAFHEYDRRRAVSAEGPMAAAPAAPVVPVPDVRVAEEKHPVAPVVTVTKTVPKEELEKVVVAALSSLPALHRSEAFAALREACTGRIADGRWGEQMPLIRAAAIAAINERARTGGATQLDPLFAKQALPLALAQLALFDRLGEKEFSRFASSGPLAKRLLTTAGPLERFVDFLDPHDDAAAALATWTRLDELEPDPAEKSRNENLQLALAYVFDKPGETDRAVAKYIWYRKAAAARKLYEDFSKIKPDELAFAVADIDSFTLEDYDWAVKTLKFPLARLGDAYGSVKYVAPAPAFSSLAELGRNGGICHHRTIYTVANGRSRGVPCAYVMDDGVVHAWFAFRTPKGWKSNFGGGQGLGAARTPNPQTREWMPEYDLFLFNDKGRTNGDFETARGIARAAETLGAGGDAAGRLQLLEAAVQRNEGDPVLWKTYTDTLLADKTTERPLLFWQNLVAHFRSRLRETPDHYAIADRIESEKVFPKTDPDRVGELLRTRRRQMMRDFPDRYDLVADTVRREGEHYLSIHDEPRFAKLYETAFKEYVGQLPAYIRIVEDFGTLAKDHPKTFKEGLAELDLVFPRKIDKNMTGGHLALRVKARVARKVSEVFALAGDQPRSDWYRERARLMDEKGKAEEAAAGG